MEGIITIVNGVARFVAVFGGAMAAIFVVWAGIQWVTAAGDPQKMAQARNGLIGCVVGLVIIGMGFSIPGIVSRWVIEPSGGVPIEGEIGVNCDSILRSQLIFQRAAGTPSRMQQVVGRVQVQNDDCSSDVWAPYVKNYLTPVSPLSGYDPGVSSGCFNVDKVGELKLPSTLKDMTRPIPHLPLNSRRDSYGNIIVYWQHPDVPVPHPLRGGAPSDSSVCWLYVDSLDVWAESYPPP